MRIVSSIIPATEIETYYKHFFKPELITIMYILKYLNTFIFKKIYRNHEYVQKHCKDMK